MIGFQFSKIVCSKLNEIPSVNGPEGESLGFADTLDAYRSLSGPAQLSGKSDISSEVGAISQPAFSQTIPELLHHITRSYAGGLTMMVEPEAEEAIDAANQRNYLLACSLPPCLTFGERDVGLFGQIVALARAGRANIEIGNGWNPWDFAYVGSVANAHLFSRLCIT
jgi:hypothetical protein